MILGVCVQVMSSIPAMFYLHVFLLLTGCCHRFWGLRRKERVKKRTSSRSSEQNEGLCREPCSVCFVSTQHDG